MNADLSLPDRNPWLGEIQPLAMLVISSVALMVVGVVMISSASMDMAAETLGNSYHYVIRQLMFAVSVCWCSFWFLPRSDER